VEEETMHTQLRWNRDQQEVLRTLTLGWSIAMGIGLALLALLATGCQIDPPIDGLEDAWDELHGEPRSGCSGVVPPDSGPFDGKIALTFDDGPDLVDTPAILDVLDSHGARGTFFVNGRQVRTDDHWRLLHDMVERGHLLGNHTENHVNSVTASFSSWQSEVQQTHDTLVEVLSEHGQAPKFFRFPYGSANCDTVAAVTALEYHVVGWHIDSADWCFQSSTGGYGYCSPSTFASVSDDYRDDFVGLTLSQASWKDGGILLFHDIHSYTADHLDELLTRLEEEGYSFTTLDDLATFPLLNGEIPPRDPWIGDPCATDDDCAFEADGEPGYCHSFQDPATLERFGFCALACDGYCPDLSGTAPTFCVASDDPQVGRCASQSSTLNDMCDAIDGTEETDADRFVYESGASASTATVCIESAANGG